MVLFFIDKDSKKRKSGPISDLMKPRMRYTTGCYIIVSVYVKRFLLCSLHINKLPAADRIKAPPSNNAINSTLTLFFIGSGTKEEDKGIEKEGKELATTDEEEKEEEKEEEEEVAGAELEATKGSGVTEFNSNVKLSSLMMVNLSAEERSVTVVAPTNDVLPLLKDMLLPEIVILNSSGLEGSIMTFPAINATVPAEELEVHMEAVEEEALLVVPIYAR